MTKPPPEPFALAYAVIAATTALREEVDPAKLQALADPIRVAMPKLAQCVDAKVERAVAIRLMLALALIGELDPEA